MFSMNSILVVLSPVLSLIAVFWSLILLVRIKDPRIIFMTALGAGIALLQLFHTFEMGGNGDVSWRPLLDLPVSLLLVGAVVSTGHLIRDLHLSEGSRDETEKIGRVVIETAVNGIVLIDRKGTMRTVNRAVEQIFGYQRSELLGRNVAMLMPEPQHSEHDRYLDNYLRTGQPKIIGIGRQVLGRRKNGHLVPLNLAVSEIRIGDEIYFAGVLQDLTDLQKERDLISATLDTAGALIVLLDIDGRIVRFNNGCQRLTGYRPEEVIGTPVWELIPEDERPAARRILDELARDGGVAEFVSSWRDRTGGLHLIEWANTTLRDGKGQVEFIVATGIDITEKQKSRQEIERLSRGVIEVQESERNRIAREIHDVLGQSLIALKLQIQNIVYDINDEDLLKECHQILTYINQIVQEARELSHSLSPLTLRNLGINRAIQELAATFESGHRIKIEVDLDHIEDYFPENWNDNLYRIVQECLINSYKHAHCDRIEVLARKADRGLFVHVHDNGRGFDREDPDDTGLGLLIMKERAQMLGAEIEFHSSSANGTDVRLFLPGRTFEDSGEQTG